MAGITAKDIGRRLFDACDEGELETIKRLLEHKEVGSIVNKKYENDETPLFRAAKKGHSKIVDILLQHKAADVDSINGDEGSTPLIAAAENAEKETAELLVKRNANVNIQKRSGPQRGWSALMCVSAKGRDKIAKTLLDHGAMIDIEGDIDPSSLRFIKETIIECGGGHKCTWTALMIACYKGDRSILQLLVKHGADINKQNDEGMSPLMFAVLEHQIMVKWFINDDNIYDSIIIHAVLEQGARVDLRLRNGGLSALMIASRLGNTATVELLLTYGAYVNARSMNGWSALMFANENGHEKTAQKLKKYGGKAYPIQPNDSETKKWLELVIACENGCTEKVIQLLKNDGVDVNMTDEDDGWSLLMIVSRSGYPELAKVLLEHGVDVNVKTTIGLSALMFATQNGQTETIKVLCSYGANINELYSYMCYSKTSESRDPRLSMSLGFMSFSHKKIKFAKVKDGHTKPFKPLLKHEADVKLQEKPLLFLAVENGHAETTKLLLKQGADIEAQDGDGNSALFIAVKNDDTTIVKLLLDYGADINMQNNDLWSPLMWASHRGYAEVATLLLEYKAQVNLQDKNGLSALMLASKNNDIQIIQKLLENGADVNMQNNDGFSALMIISESYIQLGEEEQSVSILLKYGANVNIQNKKGTSALMLACQTRNISIIQKLLENGADLNIQNDDGFSALIIASRIKDNDKIVGMLLKHGANVNMQNKKGTSALMLACETSDISIVQELLENGADTNIQNNDEFSALMIASRTKDNDKIVGMLLKHGANVNMQSCKLYLPRFSGGLSALMIASSEGSINTVLMLLEYGANMNAQNSNGWTALMFAKENGHEEVFQILKHRGIIYSMQPDDSEMKKWLELIFACENSLAKEVDHLLKLGVNVNLIPSNQELSALMVVSQYGNTQIAKLLLEHGANVDLKNGKGWSALMIASQNGQFEAADLLLDYGADINLQSNDGSSTLMVSYLLKLSELFLGRGANVNLKNNNGAAAIFIAVQKGFTKIVKFLLEHGADVNEHDNEGTSILMVAIKNENIEAMMVFLDYGADINAQNKNMWSALMFSCQKGHTQMTKLLLERGADVNLQKSNGWTALMLMIAGTSANFETANLLLKYGADINIRGSDGWSALMLARWNTYSEIAMLLVEWGAVCDSDIPTKFDELPKLDELLVLKYTDKGKNKKVRVISEARHKWKDIAGRICHDPNEIAPVQQACLADQNDCLMKLFIDHFINKKPQNYSQDWNGIIGLLDDVKLETLAEKVKCALKCMWKLPGVEECGETSVVVHSSQGQLVEWNGLKLHIHTGCLPEGLQQCTIFIKASLAGDYEIPDNTSLVSGVFWLRCEPQCTFIKPITVEIQHCSTKRDLSKLNIVRAFCSQKSLPYKFKRLKGGSFHADTFYGAIDLRGFSGVGVIEENPDSERMYYNQLFYCSCLSHQQRYEIHIAFVWNTELHLNCIKKQYPEDNFCAGHPRVVEVEGEVIKVMLDAAEWTKVMNDQWEILPVQPMVTKAALDNFKPGRWLPRCVLEARPLCEDFPELLYQIILKGIKPPLHEVLLSYMPPRIINRGSGMLSSAEAPPVYPIHRMLTSSATGRDSDLPTKFDEPPKLDELLVLKYTDKGENKKVRVISEARHKWKDIAGRICRDPNEIAVVQQACLADQNECLMKLFIDNFINKKPQNYSQDWNGIIELLDDVELETLAEKVKYALRCM